MSTNKVKKIRTQLSMSQRELAERAGTSQQQIQRIEAGKITTSLTLAKSICDALGKPMELVFPAAAKALKDLRSEMKETHYITEDALSKVADSGIEADIAEWTFKVILKGHQEPLFFSVSPSEKRRLYSVVQGEQNCSGVPFAVFDTERHRIALNLSQVSFCQFLSDAPTTSSVAPPPEVSADEEGTVVVTLVGGGPKVELGVESDVSDEGDDIGQLGHIFFMLEHDPDPGERYRIIDEEGEDAFIQTGSIALLQVDLAALDGNEAADSDEIDD